MSNQGKVSSGPCSDGRSGNPIIRSFYLLQPASQTDPAQAWHGLGLNFLTPTLEMLILAPANVLLEVDAVSSPLPGPISRLGAVIA